MLKILVVLLCGLVVVHGREPKKAKEFGCQLLGAYKEVDSQLHPGCTVKFPAIICGGYCDSNHLPSEARYMVDKSLHPEPFYQINLAEDCDCCQPSEWSSDIVMPRTAIKVLCDGKERTNLTEPISVRYPTDCDCVSCVPLSGLN